MEALIYWLGAGAGGDTQFTLLDSVEVLSLKMAALTDSSSCSHNVLTPTFQGWDVLHVVPFLEALPPDDVMI